MEKWACETASEKVYMAFFRAKSLFPILCHKTMQMNVFPLFRYYERSRRI
jgi:hypothetical protein